MGVPRVGGMTREGTVEVQMAGAQPGASGTQIWGDTRSQDVAEGQENG